jgi:fatty-acyl-CoA synthase
MALTITYVLRWWAIEQPDTVAVSLDDRQVTYRELDEWSDKIAAELVSLDVRAGERIGILSSNRLEYCALIQGALKVGAIVVPLNFRLTLSELKAVMEETSPSLLFFDDERVQTAQDVAKALRLRARPLSEVEQWKSSTKKKPLFDVLPELPVSIIFTSGSTSRPKGVVYYHQNVCIYAAEFALTEPSCARGGRTLNCAPFSASSGFLMYLVQTVLGVTQFIESKFDPERAMRIMAREKITTFQAAPIFFERISQTAEFAKADLSNLRFTQISGARIDPALLKRWRDKGIVLRPGYGLTEACGGWAARATAATDPSKCGRGGLFTEFKIRGEEGGFAPPGTQGEILLRGPSVTTRYWNNPEASNAVMQDGWLSSGDLGIMDENGVLTFVDRIKDIIISGGLNISAAEIEYVISEVKGIEEVAVISADDASFGETPMAIVYGSAEISPAKIIEHCNTHLSNYKVPRYVVVQKEPLPRLASGKIAKPALRVQYKDAASRFPKLR